MAEPLSVQLFGQPQFSVAGAAIACPSKKSLALFAYLALTRTAHTRRALAGLLWGHRDEEAARNSLRAALHRLPEALMRCLAIDRDTIAIDTSQGPLVDVTRFDALASASDVEGLESAAALYRDELLKDFEPSATAEFDDWLHAERVRLRQLADRVFDSLIARRADRARLDTARATVERESALGTALRWTALMPGSEAGHRWLMRLYLDMGRRDAALAQYELCQRQLAVLFGRLPSPETMQLRDAALAAGAASAGDAGLAERDRSEPAPATPVDRAIVAGTSFVGRIEELAELDGLLADPACRLVTLHGLGGAGKTRLAHAIATQVGARFTHGVSWVPLDASVSRSALPTVLAEAIGRQLPPHGEPVTALAQMLTRQQRLIVLDNFESLLHEDDEPADVDAVALVATLLQAAPQLRILVTSREVLGLQEEWVYEVRGLACPSGAAEPASLASVPAVELFAQRARQAYLGFSLSAEMPHVLRICRLVEGLPLGIELAAAWVRTIPCADIAAAIELEVGAIPNRHRNRPDRHQSLDAVVACSWQLLSDEQRNALAALGVFVGGFARDAAERIAGASLRMLSALADKSLVRRRASGRYDLHEIVRRFALARLRQARRHAPVRKLHAEHYATLLLRLVVDLKSPDEVPADALVRTELANVLAAWRHAIESDDIDALERIAAPLIVMLHTRGMVAAAMSEAERACRALAQCRRNDVLAAVRMQWGRAALSAARFDVARRELDAAVAKARNAARAELIARCLVYRSGLDYMQANLDSAEALADEALALARDSTDPELRMLVHNCRASVANLRTQFDVAEPLLRKGLEAARELGAPSAIAQMLCALGVPLYYRGMLAESAALTAEATRIFERLGNATAACLIRGNLAAITLAQGDFAAALEHAEAGVRLARDTGDDAQLCGNLATLGDVLLRQGETARARATLDECLRLGPEPLTHSEALYLLARIELAGEAPEPALRNIVRLRDVLDRHRIEVRVPMLVIAAAAYAATHTRDRARARSWLATLVKQEDVDASLRATARELLDRASERPTGEVKAHASIAEVERDVAAFLAEATSAR